MTITIRMDAGTASALVAGKYSLYGFRASRVVNTAALPVVWFAMPVLPNISLDWEPRLQGYLSVTPVRAGRKVFVGASTPMTAGTTLQIGSDGATTVTQEGPASAITFDNGAPQPYTCGIAQAMAGGALVPLCAFPVGPNAEQGVEPADAILLLFSTDVLQPGTIVNDYRPPRRANGLIDGGGNSGVAGQTEGLFVVDTSEPRALAFSIDSGKWTWGDGAWAQTVAAKAPIVPLLIRSA